VPSLNLRSQAYKIGSSWEERTANAVLAQSGFGDGDVDIWFVGLTAEQAEVKLQQMLQQINKNGVGLGVCLGC
jgi:phosphoribosylformylglycinamidine (FGAM) synthase-like amidotransferase family enzyme